MSSQTMDTVEQRIKELTEERLSRSYIDHEDAAYPAGITRGIYLVWEDDDITTSIPIFNYWRLRIGIEPTIRMTLYSKEGELLVTEDRSFDEHQWTQDIRFKEILEENGIERPFMGGAWLEVMADGLRFPHLGCVVQYRSKTDLGQVHTSNWAGEDKRSYITEQHVPVWSSESINSYIYFPNGHIGVDSVLKCTLMNQSGESMSTEVPIKLNPFGTYFAYVHELFPDANTFLGGGPGWLNSDLPSAGVNKRAFVGAFNKESLSISTEHTTSYVYKELKGGGGKKAEAHCRYPWPDSNNVDFSIYLNNMTEPMTAWIDYYKINGDVAGRTRVDLPSDSEFQNISVSELCELSEEERGEVSFVGFTLEGAKTVPDVAAVWQRDGAPICVCNLGMTAIVPPPSFQDALVKKLRRQAGDLLRKSGLRPALQKTLKNRPRSRWMPLLGDDEFDVYFMAINASDTGDMVLRLQLYTDASETPEEATMEIAAGAADVVELAKRFKTVSKPHRAAYLVANIESGGESAYYYYYGINRKSGLFYCDHTF